MQRVRFGVRSLPGALALTTIIAYGLLLPLTGFYWDDWPFAWIARFLGPKEFFPAFEGFRPFLAPIFFLTTSVLPTDPVLWQIAALGIRFAAAWAAWWSLRQVWSTDNRLTVAATLLFLVFPGYSQHWVALTHINQEWISLVAYILSFGVSVRALRQPEGGLPTVMGALALQAIGLLPTEYFATLEPLRALLFWSVLSQHTPRLATRFRKTFAAWWPYAILWLLNAAWLFQYYRSGAYISYGLSAATTPLTSGEVVTAFGDALLKAALLVWVQVIPLTVGLMGSPTAVLTWILIGLTAAGSAFYLAGLQDASRAPGIKGQVIPDDAGHGSPRMVAVHAVAIGVAGVLLGRMPSFVAGLPLTLQSSFDRLTISMMLPAALLVAGALELLVRSAKVRTYLLSALFALAIGQQFFNANIFRRDWQRQQDIYWQFAWRMPGIKPDTAILTHQMPLDYETDLSMTAALNWMYAPAVVRPHLPFAVVYTEKRLGGVVLPALRPGLPMELPLRTMTFRGNTSQVIAVYVPPAGCLHVFDPDLDDAWTYSRLPDSVTQAIPLSDPGRIITDAQSPKLPSPPFAPEPEHGWCYFYEKAELARQVRDWLAILDLRQLVSNSGLQPLDQFEWLPFIEAEALAGDMTWAAQSSVELVRVEPRLQRGMCALWLRVQAQQSSGSREESRRLHSELACE